MMRSGGSTSAGTVTSSASWPAAARIWPTHSRIIGVVDSPTLKTCPVASGVSRAASTAWATSPTWIRVQRQVPSPMGMRRRLARTRRRMNSSRCAHRLRHRPFPVAARWPRAAGTAVRRQACRSSACRGHSPPGLDRCRGVDIDPRAAGNLHPAARECRLGHTAVYDEHLITPAHQRLGDPLTDEPRAAPRPVRAQTVGVR